MLDCVMAPSPSTLLLCTLCCVLSILWVNLFPFVSITTGELKPRRIFVDEHAYHISAITSNTARVGDVKQALALAERKSSRSFADFCKGTVLCEVECYNNSGTHRSCIALDTYRSALRSSGGEAISIVVPWYSDEVSDDSVRMRLGQAVGALAELSDTLSKDVVLIHVQVDCGGSVGRDVCSTSSAGVRSARYSQTLATWLQKTHSGGRGTDNGIGAGSFLLRDAYVVDFGEVPSSASVQGGAAGWDGVAASFAGYNGLLPNMDILGVAKAVLPEIEFTGTFNTFSLLAHHGGPLLTALGVHPGHSLPLHKPLPHDAAGAELGLHSQFLERNVDSVTFVPFDMGSRARRAVPVVPEALLFAFVAGLVRASSNLYEELHHSNHYYLLMDAYHFVGLPEFSPSLVLLMVALGLQYLARCGSTVRIASGSETAGCGGPKVCDSTGKADTAGTGSVPDTETENTLAEDERVKSDARRRAFEVAAVALAADCGWVLAALTGVHMLVSAGFCDSSAPSLGAWCAVMVPVGGSGVDNYRQAISTVLIVTVAPTLVRCFGVVSGACTASEGGARVGTALLQRFHHATTMNCYFSLCCASSLALLAAAGLRDYILAYCAGVPLTLALVLVMETVISSSTVVPLERVLCDGQSGVAAGDQDSLQGAYRDLLGRKTMFSRILRSLRGKRSRPEAGGELGTASTGGHAAVVDAPQKWTILGAYLILVGFVLAVAFSLHVTEHSWVQVLELYFRLWISVFPVLILCLNLVMIAAYRGLVYIWEQ